MGVFPHRLYNLQDHTEIGTLVQHDGNLTFSFTHDLAILLQEPLPIYASLAVHI